MYRKVILKNGLRVVAERLPELRSVTIGLWVNVGSRDEVHGEEGYSHFIEHMFFKGTTSRSAAQISREIDALGGELNAFTTRETTTLYVKVLDQHLKPALTLLSDLFHRSRFDPRDVEKEKQVVLEEVRTVQDDPEDFLQELHTRQTLHRHPLGRPILGEVATIQRLRRKDLLHYIETHYHPLETVLAVAGNFQFKTLIPLVEDAFGSFQGHGRPHVRRWPPEVAGGVLVHRKPLEQAHLCLGLKGIPIDHKDRYAAYVLNAVLGGSVSSRLFHEVREKRGLAYSIYSYLSTYSDGGTLTVYAASRPREAPRVVELTTREIRRLRASGLDRKELQRAKNQMKGNVMLSLESSHSRMHKLAKDELSRGRHASLEEILEDIDRVSDDQVSRLGSELLDSRYLAVTALGPVSQRGLSQAIC